MNIISLSGLQVKKLHPMAQLPTKNEESAGYDLYSVYEETIPPGVFKIIPLEIAVDIPYGYFGKIMDRSGLAANHGLTVLAGVIDNDYRGEWKVVLYNSSDTWYNVCRGDRIAQVVFLPYGSFQVSEVNELGSTDRGSDGFGSSGY